MFSYSSYVPTQYDTNGLTTYGYYTPVYTSFYAIGETEKCKGKADVKANNAKATWKVSCNNALIALDVPPDVRAKLELLLGGKGGVIDVNKDKINIKGKCKEAECLIP